MQSKKIILSLIAALAFTAGPATASDVYSVDTFAIGTLINGQFKVDSKEKAEACYKILNDETRRLEYILSAYDPDSDVTRLNQHPGEWIQIEPETFEVLNGSKTIAALTHGTFDPTVGALVKLWSVDQPEHRVPSEAEIKRALINVDYNLIDAKKENGRYFGKIGKKQSVAFGAIGVPLIVAASVSGLDQMTVSAIAGRQLPILALIVPLWVCVTMCGFKRSMEVLPAILVAGLCFAISQFVFSNYHLSLIHI